MVLCTEENRLNKTCTYYIRTNIEVVTLRSLIMHTNSPAAGKYSRATPSCSRAGGVSGSESTALGHTPVALLRYTQFDHQRYISKDHMQILVISGVRALA